MKILDDSGFMSTPHNSGTCGARPKPLQIWQVLSGLRVSPVHHVYIPKAQCLGYKGYLRLPSVCIHREKALQGRLVLPFNKHPCQTRPRTPPHLIRSRTPHLAHFWRSSWLKRSRPRKTRARLDGFRQGVVSCAEQQFLRWVLQGVCTMRLLCRAAEDAQQRAVRSPL